MPSLPLKKLYFADSVEELQKKANVNKSALSDKQTSKLIKTADKMLNEAKKYYKQKDEEMAFIFYFKFVDLILILSDRKDATQETSWSSLSKCANDAFDMAQELKKSLTKRYSDKCKIENGPETEVKLTATKNECENNVEMNGISGDASTGFECEKKINDGSISPAEVLSLITEGKKSYIIMDVRSAKDYEESHIKHSSCISIPSEILLPGITSNALEKSLPFLSKAKWFERGKVDYVILVDWDTVNTSLSNDALLILQNAMTKWDMTTSLKEPPLFLKGGYKEWLLRYPMYCTKALDILSLEAMGSLQITDVSDINFPDLDEADLVTDRNRKNVAPQENSPRPLFFRDTKPDIQPREPMSNVFTQVTNLDTSAKFIDKPNTNIDISSIKTSQSVSSNQAKENIKPIPGFDRSLKPSTVINKVFTSETEISFQPPQIPPNVVKDDDRFLKDLKSTDGIIEQKQENQSPRIVKPVKPLNNESTIKPVIPFEKEKCPDEGDNLGNKLKLSAHEKLSIKKPGDQNEINKLFPEISSAKEPRKSEVFVVPLKEDGATRGLTRSYSSPNIAELIPNETKKTLPTVDRSTKPKMDQLFRPVNDNLKIVRNLNPIYGHCPGRPVTGLRNLGNTCYMNAIIQCLSNTELLSSYFINEQYRQHLRRNKIGSNGEVAEEFAIVIRALWMGTYKSIAPRDLKNCLARYIVMCAGHEQQDSHEFLMLLIDKLHIDINQGREVEPLADLDSLPVSVATEKFWNHYRLKNKSKVSDLFEGLLKSTLKCSSCEMTSSSYEVFSCLSLPISNKRTVKECLEGFLKSEKMFGEGAWFCPGCKQKKEAEKSLTICKFPRILIIQLKRFSYIGMWKEKLQTTIKYESALDVVGKVYDLYGIVNHVGCLEGGHYTACCKHPSSSDWYKYDDHEASKILFSEIPTSAAYMFFYTLRER